MQEQVNEGRRDPRDPIESLEGREFALTLTGAQLCTMLAKAFFANFTPRPPAVGDTEGVVEVRVGIEDTPLRLRPLSLLKYDEVTPALVMGGTAEAGGNPYAFEAVISLVTGRGQMTKLRLDRES